MEANYEARLAIAGEFLSDAAIDWRCHDNGSIYVTSLDFNFWIEALPDSQGYQFQTYWPFCSSTKPDEALAFANECNLTLQMVQFSFEPSKFRLQGHCVLYAPVEIERRCFVGSARKFASIFASVMDSDGAYVLAAEIEPQSARPFSGTSRTTH